MILRWYLLINSGTVLVPFNGGTFAVNFQWITGEINGKMTGELPVKLPVNYRWNCWLITGGIAG